MGKNSTFESLDFVDDAVDLLQQGRFPYLLLVGTHPQVTQIDADIDFDTETEEEVISEIRAFFKKRREDGY